MAPLTSEEIEEKLAGLEEEIAQMRIEERQAWGALLAYLRGRFRSVSQDRAGIERACEELEGLRGEGS